MLQSRYIFFKFLYVFVEIFLWVHFSNIQYPGILLTESTSFHNMKPQTLPQLSYQRCQKELAAALWWRLGVAAAGYLWEMIEEMKSYQPEVKASKSYQWLRSYGHLNICIGWALFGSIWMPLTWTVQGAGADSSPCRRLSEKFWDPCKLLVYCDPNLPTTNTLFNTCIWVYSTCSRTCFHYTLY